MDPKARYEKRLGLSIADREGHTFVLERLLGYGSTSAVYEARRSPSSEPDERVAVKMLHPALCGDAAVVQRFLREAYVANTIRHRSIVRVLGDGTADLGAAFLILELVRGETLEDRRLRRGGKLAFDTEYVKHTIELMSALSAVHDKGIVHRDLKPQNVFITEAGQVKLLDFGTARIFDAEGGDPISIEGLVIGTPSFMSPEQARGERDAIDACSDVWSLGATMFFTLSGEFVHPAPNAHQRLLAAALRPPRSLATTATELPPGVIAVVDRALAFKKQERWQDVASMSVAFRAAARAASVPVPLE